MRLNKQERIRKKLSGGFTKYYKALNLEKIDIM